MAYSLKKAAAAVITASALLLAACGGEEESSSSQNKKVLNVGTEATFAPFEFMDKGEVSGFDVDLLNAAAEEAGYEVDIKNTGWDAMLAGLQSGQVDIGMSGITITDERKETYDFSVPYFESVTMIVFKEGTDIKAAEDLKSKKVGVQNGTTGQIAAETILGKNNSAISKYKSAALTFQALQSGDVEAVVTDIAVAVEYAKSNPDADVETITDDQFVPEYYGIAFPKNSEYKADFDKALNTLYENGTYAEIYEKWFNEKPDMEALKQAAQ